MKEGWKIKKLGEICKIVGGSTPKTNIPSYWIGGTHYWITPAELNGSKYISSTTRTITDAGVKSAHLQLLPAGTVLLSSRAPIGKVAITTVPMYCNQGFKNLICNDDVLYNEYAYYFLLHNTKYLNSLGTGATFKEISKKIVEQIPVPIPSFPEQQRIVEILDAEFVKIDALKANAEKSLQAAKDLFQSALKQALEPKSDWNVYKLKDVCKEYGDYGMSVPSKPYKDIRYLRITDITEWGELNDDKVSADTNSIDDKYLLQEGDVLFARTGATVGKSLVYKSTMGRCSYAGYLIRYRLNQDMILPQLLFYITHSKSYYDWIKANQKSTTLPNISAKIYNEYEISIPSSLINQKNITTQLDNLDERCKALQENYRKTIALCEDLKQALLRKAFNGEL